MVMKHGLALAGVGVVVGCLFAAGATHLITGALYGIGAGDPVSWLASAAIVIAVSALANVVPARRAMRVAPSEALRTE